MPAFTIELPNGRHLDVEADDENAAISGAQGWYKQNVTDKTDTSAMGALSQGALDVASGVGSTIKNYISPETGKSIEGAAAAKADPKYKRATESFAHPEDGADNHLLGLDWKQAPRALLEQAPALASDVVVQKLLKRFGPLAQVAGGLLNYGARSAGNEAQKRASARTGDDSAEPNFEDKAIGLGSTALQGALNTYSAGKLANPGNAAKGILPAAGNVIKAAGTEGVTNAAQSAISDAAATAGTDQGLSVDGKDALASGVLGTLGGAGFAAPHMVKATAQSAHTRGADQGEHSTFAANRLIEKAGGVEKLEDPQAAYHAMSGALSDVNGEISRAAGRITAPATETANALRRAQSGEALTANELKAIDAEGDTQLSSLVREQTSLVQMTEKGNYNSKEQRWAGGVGEFARNHAGKALSALGGLSAIPHIAANGMAGVDTLMSALPGAGGAVLAGVAGYKALKKIESMAGVQSPARSFAERFGDDTGNVRAPLPMNQSPTGPKVIPQNSLTPAQPWGPVADKPTPFKPDMLDSNLQKIVEKIQNQKRRDTAQAVMPLLRQLAEQNKPAPEAPGLDVNALNEQIKSAMLMASARRKIEGQRQAEAEAAASPMIDEQGGLEAVRNPAMGKRANELISAANALAKLRRQPEETEAPPTAPEMPAQPQPDAPDGAMAMLHAMREQSKTQDTPEFTLPESPHVFKDPKTAAHSIYEEAVAGGKEVRHPEGFKAGTARRLAGEEAIYNTISKSLANVQERGDFHKYLSALWGSDSPEVVKQVRDHMLASFPQHAATINKHLSDEAIKGLWTKPAKKKSSAR